MTTRSLCAECDWEKTSQKQDNRGGRLNGGCITTTTWTRHRQGFHPTLLITQDSPRSLEAQQTYP